MDQFEVLSPAVRARLEEAMGEAIAEARLARPPFGAVLLDAASGNTVARARNTILDGDPTAHAEVNVLRKAGSAGIDLSSTVLLATAEPCVMCAAAAIWSRVAAAGPEAFRAAGWSGLLLPPEALLEAAPGRPTIPWLRGVREAEAAALYAAHPRSYYVPTR
jgi:hypothetical protein